MKKFSAVVRTAVIFAIFIVLLLAVSVYLLLPKTLNVQRYAAFVNRNVPALTEIANHSLTGDLSMNIFERILLSRGKIDHVWQQEDRIIFSIDSHYAPAEGQIQLIYFPDGEYAFPFDDPEWYPVETGDENALRWEGGYAGGNGSVNVTRLTDGFYLEYAYLPT